MMNIGLHDAEAEHLKNANKFPNLALMKISAWHKAQGDSVEWWMPMGIYDKVYSSKVFEFTPENDMLPPDTIKGGTGYGLYENLPDEIDTMFPDYSIYPNCDYAIGYITRGCIRKCRWCVVPRKEGMIHPYSRWQDIVRDDTKKLTLMDNNILACEYGISQLAELAETDYRIDINQGMDARLVTEDIADILAKIKWQKNIRFSCDQVSQIEHIKRVVDLLVERGVAESRVFVYMLITKDVEDNLRRIYAMRDTGKHGSLTIYAQAERNPAMGINPDHWQLAMAQKYCYRGLWRHMDWDEFVERHPEYKVGKEQR